MNCGLEKIRNFTVKSKLVYAFIFFSVANILALL